MSNRVSSELLLRKNSSTNGIVANKLSSTLTLAPLPLSHFLLGPREPTLVKISNLMYSRRSNEREQGKLFLLELLDSSLPPFGCRTIPARDHGGNADIKNLSRGATAFLPVYIPGANLSVGDLREFKVLASVFVQH